MLFVLVPVAFGASAASNPSTKAFIQQITSIRDAAGGSPDTATCTTSAEAGGTTPAVTRLDGEWQVTYTRSQFFAAGADPTEAIPGNWGHFSLTFDRGHFSDIGAGGRLRLREICLERR
jgi:hypothetical protein